MKGSVKIPSNRYMIIHDYGNNLEFSIGERRRAAVRAGFRLTAGK
jgi:hypothetical protein